MNPAMTDPQKSRMPSWLPEINRRVINPVQRLWAPYLPPFALVIHRGRKSGTEHRSPVLAYRSGATLAIPLAYGSSAQWVKNVLAADGATVVRLGHRYRLVDPQVVVDAGQGQLPGLMRRVSRRMGVLKARLEPLP
jgi:deazaflavin-dependent oxidoreductase (nitroreductase family)